MAATGFTFAGVKGRTGSTRQFVVVTANRAGFPPRIDIEYRTDVYERARRRFHELAGRGYPVAIIDTAVGKDILAWLPREERS